LPADIDWPRTIQRNLKHWIPERRTVVPAHLVGYGRRQRSLARDVIVAVDQSASMAGSVVYASVFACVLAKLPSLRTSLVAFDTAIADLTDLLRDPVDVLFGVQLGGGTDIGAALGYCHRLVDRPRDSVLFLITDLFEGGHVATMRTRVAELVRDGVTVVVLLALSDDGVGAFDHHEAAALGALGAAVLACTPDTFPDVLAASLEGAAGPTWSAGRPSGASRPSPPDWDQDDLAVLGGGGWRRRERLRLLEEADEGRAEELHRLREPSDQRC
jgi:hypothetical protein